MSTVVIEAQCGMNQNVYQDHTEDASRVFLKISSLRHDIGLFVAVSHFFALVEHTGDEWSPCEHCGDRGAMW